MIQKRQRKVIVIGAGMSGLACARELQHRGHQVLVVEAHSRVGGRLKAPSDVDLGGALIHGVEGNPWRVMGVTLVTFEI